MAEFNLEDNNLQVNLEPANDLGVDLSLGNQPTTSLVEHPTTTILPAFRFAFSLSSAIVAFVCS